MIDPSTPQLVPVQDTGTTTTTASYPLDLLRQVAAQILIDAGQAQLDLETLRQASGSYLQTLPGMLSDSMLALLHKHYERLNDAYQWQLDFANALFDMAQIIEDAEQGIVDSFNYQTGTVDNGDGQGNSPRPTHGPTANV
ncbi:MAG: hypothetical protein ACRDHW_22090 [Ktedonobacteraceae bacterium]